ncbi:MAG: Gfo/Idh/MocA family protein [Candidatus Ratteibacteria bacterium]
MINKPIFKGAVIGLGFIGAGDEVSGRAIGQDVRNLDGTHAQAMASNSHIKLVAGASRDEGRRARFKQKFPDTKVYSDWREMIEVEKPDIVSIATHTPSHAEITIGCAQSGVRAIFCEKPIATKLSDADRMIETCDKYGTILAINHTRRWNKFWSKCGEIVQSDTIGKVQNAFVHWPTGRLGNIGTHMFDILRMITGQEPLAVSGSLDPVLYPDCRGPQYKDFGGWGIILFSSGMRAFIDAPQAGLFPLVVRVTGDRGEIVIQNRCAKINFWQDGSKEIVPETGDKTSLDYAMEDIVSCLVEAGSPACTGKDGLIALEVIIGFHVSHGSGGKWIYLPIQGNDRNFEVMMG